MKALPWHVLADGPAVGAADVAGARTAVVDRTAGRRSASISRARARACVGGCVKARGPCVYRPHCGVGGLDPRIGARILSRSRVEAACVQVSVRASARVTRAWARGDRYLAKPAEVARLSLSIAELLRDRLLEPRTTEATPSAP